MGVPTVRPAMASSNFVCLTVSLCFKGTRRELCLFEKFIGDENKFLSKEVTIEEDIKKFCRKGSLDVK